MYSVDSEYSVYSVYSVCSVYSVISVYSVYSVVPSICFDKILSLPVSTIRLPPIPTRALGFSMERDIAVFFDSPTPGWGEDVPAPMGKTPFDLLVLGDKRGLLLLSSCCCSDNVYVYVCGWVGGGERGGRVRIRVSLREG